MNDGSSLESPFWKRTLGVNSTCESVKQVEQESTMYQYKVEKEMKRSLVDRVRYCMEAKVNKRQTSRPKNKIVNSIR